MMRVTVLWMLMWLSANVSSHAQSLAGIWVAFPDLGGAVFPHIEELRILPDGQVTTSIYGVRRLPSCEDKAKLGNCAAGRTSVAGRLEIDAKAGTISVADKRLSANAMDGIGTGDDERLARELFWFGFGAPWSFRHEGNVLAMSRRSSPSVPNTGLDGSKAVTVERRYYLVDADFAENLVGFVELGGYSMAKMGCVAAFIAGPNSPGQFRAILRDSGIVYRKREQMQADLYALSKPPAQMVKAYMDVTRALTAEDRVRSADEIAEAAKGLGLPVGQVAMLRAKS